jgi:alpha-galactosidase
MGWNSWNCFRCDIDEAMIREIADAIVSSGMRDAGYRYVTLDDGWMALARQSDGTLMADPARFPSGVRALSDYVHRRGLLLGIYSDVGVKTCAGYPGSAGHFSQDARAFADWGVDLLKLDWCYTTTEDDPRTRYRQMRQALDATGRRIVLSVCDWGIDEPWLWPPGTGELFRTTGDIRPSWDTVMNIVDQQVGISEYGGPGHWNDPDMLEVGNPGMTDDEYRAHMALWAVLAAPLIAGHDVRTMTPEVAAILMNRDVLDINQDPAGLPARRLQHDCSCDVWVRELADGSRAVLLLNRGPVARLVAADAEICGFPARGYTARDLWAGDTSVSHGPLTAALRSHEAALYRLAPITASPAATSARAYRASGGETIDSGDGAVTATVETTPTHGGNSAPASAPSDWKAPRPRSESYLCELPWIEAINGAWSGWYPQIQRDRSVSGRPLTIGGRTYRHGLGVHAFSQVHFYLGGASIKLLADVGVDDEEPRQELFYDSSLAAGTVEFEVWGDSRLLWASPVMSRGGGACTIDVDLHGVQVVCLAVGDAGDGTFQDYANWADVRLLTR